MAKTKANSITNPAIETSAHQKEPNVRIVPSQHRLEGRCHYYMVRKNRFCHQRIHPSSYSSSTTIDATTDDGRTQLPRYYCSHHQLLEKEEDSIDIKNKRIRIACPIDPSHSIFQDSVEKHVQICPKTKQRLKEQAQIYYRENINQGGHGIYTESDKKDAKLTEEEMQTLALRVLDVYQKLFLLGNDKDIPVTNITYSQIYDSMPIFPKNTDTIYSDAADLLNSFAKHGLKSGGWKHVVQQTSMVSVIRSNIDKNDKNNLVIIDMGAGRGMLGLVVAGIINNDNNDNKLIHLLLVERGSSKAKADGKIRRHAAATTKATIYNSSDPQIIDNNAADTQSSCDGPVTQNHVGQALCSTATDVTNINNNQHLSNTNMEMKIDTIQLNRIRCDLAHVHLDTAIQWALDDNNNNKKSIHSEQSFTTESKVARSTITANPSTIVVVAKHLCGCGTDYALKSMATTTTNVDGCFLATCCHGVCNWKDYVGRDTLIELFQGTTFGKQEFDVVTKWATGTVCCGCHNDHEEGTSPSSQRFGQAMSELVHNLQLKCGVSGLGRCCQRILDYGRMEYMRNELGFSYCEIVHFVDESITPQNALLVGSR